MAALSSAEYLISQRNKVGFFGVGEFIERIPPAMGKRQLLRINEFLIDTHSSYPLHDEVFKARLQQGLLPFIPPVSQVVLVSPIYNRLMADFLIKLVQEGHHVIHIFPRLEDMNECGMDADRPSKIANSLLLIKREYTITKIANLGIQQVWWFPNGPKYEMLKIRQAR